MKASLTVIERFYGVALALCSFLIIVAPKLVPITIALCALTSFLGLYKKEFRVKSMPNLLIMLCFFYFLYVFGLFFSSNVDVGLKYIEYKLSFLIFPLLFIIQPKNGIQIKFPMYGLLIGIFLISIYGLVKATKCYIEIDYFFDCFVSSHLTSEHPTYFTVFVTMAIATVWYFYAQKERFFGLFNSILITCFLFFMMLLSFAMAGLLFAFILIVVLILLFIWNKFGKVYGLASLIIGPIIILTVIFKAPGLKDETANTYNSLKTYLANPTEFVAYNEKHSGDDVRLIMWTASFNVFMKHPMGVGTGDVDLALSKELRLFGQDEFAKLDDRNMILYNPHNQYLQTANEIGIIGLLVFLFIVFGGMAYAIRTKNWLLLLLIVNLAFNCIFESMLQRQSGIVFYSFWICLLTIQNFEKPNTKDDKMDKKIV